MNSVVSLVVCSVMMLNGASAVKPTGRAYYYEPGIFRQVAHNRGMPMLWSKVDGFASVPDCKKVDPARPWYVDARLYDLAAGHWSAVLTLQVVDCSDPRHLKAHYAKGIAPNGLEVDWSTAKRYHFTKEGKTLAIVLGFGRLK